MNNKIKTMSVNDMQSVYGGYDLPEVECTGDINRFYEHVGEVAGQGIDPSYLILNYIYYSIFGF